MIRAAIKACPKQSALFVVLGLLTAVSVGANAFESPATPEKVLAAFQHDPGLQVELVAAEPLVFQPCAVAWDADGRMYVVENRGYPTGPGPGKPPLGTIVRLDDTDGDGRMDRRTLFADGLTFPNGLMPWNGGFIVTCAPDILFVKDNKGVGRADERRVLLTGFDTHGSTQLRVSHPMFGPDGWIYVTSGLTRAGKITSPQHPERAAVEIGTDARFNPFTLEIQAVGGRGQFGQTFDEAGNRFHCMNRIHIQHTVIPPYFLARNPSLVFSETVQNVPEAMVTDLIGGANQNFAARLYPISENITTADSHAGTFTAACGVHIFRGDALPPEYRGDAFACDPTGNLVHRDKLTPAGPTFSSRMANEGREFLASPDNWFRPVFLATGPDGALYICDMYRKTIEHPDYLPVEVRRHTDFDSGRNMGRIWRVTSRSTYTASRESSAGKRSQTVHLQRASTKQLIRTLGHPNVWQRETAQRLLVERRDPSAPKKLASCFNPSGEAVFKQRADILLNPSGWARLCDKSQPENAFGQLYALRTLASLTENQTGTLHTSADEPHAIPAMLDQPLRISVLSPDPLLRENAWRILAEYRSGLTGLSPELLTAFGSDPNPRARFWFALGFQHGPPNACTADWTVVLERLVRGDGNNRWMRAAIFSALKPGQALLLAHDLAREDLEPAPVDFWSDLGRLLGAETGALPDFGTAPATPWLIAALNGVAESLRQQAKPVVLPQEIQSRLAGEAVRLARSPAEPASTRKAAIGFLANIDAAQAAVALVSILTPTEPADLQLAAVRALLALPGEAAVEQLLAPDLWNSLSPNTRAVVVGSALSQPRHVRVLLNAIEAQRLKPNILSQAQRESLKKHSDETIREQARKLFADTAPADRIKAYEQARTALALTGHAANGRKVFATHCASCHRLDREGHNVGPDLLGIRNQPKESILLHIVQPNYEVLAGFNACIVECKDGRELTGLIIGDSSSSVTLRQAQGIEETIPRSAITRLTISQVSLMPEGLEPAMSRQDLADLLACLKGEAE